MRKTVRIAMAMAAVPVLGATTMGAAMAANDPAEVVIPSLDAQYVGPLSTAGKKPKIQVEGSEVSLAFVNLTTYKTVSKVAKGTDGEAEAKGTVVKIEGYRCKAKSFSVVNPGTAGEYQKVKWKCTFKAADTPSQITLTYTQSSL